MAGVTHFLQLPGEIRNQIYGHVVDEITTLRINKNGLLVPLALASVCRQVYEELQDSELLGYSLKTRSSVQLVEAHVTDCDFGHVAKFLDGVARHGFTKVGAIKIHLNLTGAAISTEAISQWICRIGLDGDENSTSLAKRSYTLNVGSKNMEPFELGYEITATHMSDRDCACSKLINTLGGLLSGGYGTHQYSAAWKLRHEVFKAHVAMRTERKQAEAERRLHRYIRYSEEKNGCRGRFWLERIRQAHLSGQNMASLKHTVRRPKRFQEMLFESIGAWAVRGNATRAVGEAKSIGGDDDDDDDDALDSDAFTYIKPDGNGSMLSSRLSTINLKEKCANLRARGKPQNVWKAHDR